jgi:PAS domain S-box-containing protein
MSRERRNMFRASLLVEPLWRRLGLAGVALGVYVAAFLPLYRQAGAGISALSLFPVVVAGWLFGAWGGLLAGMLSVPLNALLLSLAGEAGWALVVDGAEGSALVLVVGAVVGLLRDLGLRLDQHLTEWRRSERELRATEDRYRALFERSRDPLFVSRPDGSLVAANDALLRLMDVPRTRLLEHDVTRLFVDPEDRDRYQEELGRAGFVEDLPVRLRLDDGGIRECLLTASARHGPGRAVMEHQGSLRDVSDSRTLHSLAERRTRELERAVHELEAFTYSVSHDLRSHLVTMGGFASILDTEHRESLDETARDYLDRILRASRRMDAFVQDLLTYSRVTHAEVVPERVPLQAVVEDAMASLEGTLREREARVEVAGGLPEVEGDRVLLDRVVENLLSNAVKFVPPGRTPEVRVRSAVEGRRARLEVEDNGVGIEPGQLPGVFEAFERLHPGRFPGTGVGLTIVKRAMDRLGGEVGVHSRPGEGSVFWVVLTEAVPTRIPARRSG